MPAPPTGNLAENYERLSQMDDNTMNNMVNMMKSNPAMMKAQYEAASGTKMTDEQFANIMNMMNPEMIKMTSNMMKSNPDMM